MRLFRYGVKFRGRETRNFDSARNKFQEICMRFQLVHFNNPIHCPEREAKS